LVEVAKTWKAGTEGKLLELLLAVAGGKDGPVSLCEEEGGSLEFSTTAALVQSEVSVLDPFGRRRAGCLQLSFVTPARLPAAGKLTPAL